MQLRIASYHSVDQFEDLLGIRADGPGSTGETASTWRLAPGLYPRVYGHHEWGAEGIVSVLWDPARPVVWDEDLPTRDNPGRTCAVLASAVLVLEQDNLWRCYAPPGGDPMLLAGVIRFRGTQKTMSILGHSAERFPRVVLFENAHAWLHGGAPTLQRAKQLPPVERSWFRGWRIAPPDAPELNTDAILHPLLD